MGSIHRVEFELRCDDWRRGKSKDIVDEFDEAEADTGYDESIIVTYEIPQSEFWYVPDEMEAYRLARNKAEAKIEFMGWSNVTFSNVTVEKVEREPEYIENPTIDDVNNWVEYEEGDSCDWIHEPTNQWVAIREDGPDVSEDWHSDRWCEESPWVIEHKFTVIGRAETEEDARERAVEWMAGEPYGLNPADSYM